MKLLNPSTTYVCFDGDLSGPEAKTISLQLAEWIQDVDSTYIADITRLGTLGAEARKELGAERRPPVTDRPIKTDIAFIGATMRTKVLMSVILTGVRVLSNSKMSSHYFPTGAEAAAWARLDLALLGP